MQHNNSELKPVSLNVLKTGVVDLTEGPRMITNEPAIELLQSVFAVSTGSTWRSNNPDHLAKAKKQHADVFLGDITSFGMPMGVLLDGCGRHAEPKEIHAIATKLMEMLNELAHEVHEKKLSEKTIQTLIKEKYQSLDTALQYKYASNASFVAVLVYLDEGGMQKVLSFGTGDAMVVLCDQKKIDVLIKAVNCPNGAPIPFPSTNMVGGNLEAALKHLQVSIIHVSSCDRILLMTDGAYEALPIQEVLSEDKSIKYRAINSSVHPQEYYATSLARSADDTIRAQFDDKKILGPVTVGDDATFAEIHVPSVLLQNQLAFVYTLKEYMAKRAEERKVPSTTQSALQYVSLYNKGADSSDADEPQDYAQVKINAAQKMIEALSDSEVEFTKEDIIALRNSGRYRTTDNLGLGQIVSIFEKKGVLPEAFVKAEAKYKAECRLV